MDIACRIWEKNACYVLINKKPEGKSPLEKHTIGKAIPVTGRVGP
jgi:hypothetical protein